VGRRRNAEAIPFFLRAIDLRPRKARLHLALAAAYASLNRLTGAARSYSEAIRLNPNDALAHHNLGLIYQHEHRLDLALREYRAAVDIAPDDPRHHETLAVMLYAVGDYPASWAQLQEVARLGVRPNADLVNALRQEMRRR